VYDALALLQHSLPDEHDHALRALDVITHRAFECGPGAIACTAGPVGSACVFRQHPLSMPLVEVALTISHEARHHGFDHYGRRFTIQHVCRDCSDPRERARDPIYRRDDVVRARLRAAMPPLRLLGLGDYVSG